jgi:DNA mismatch repair protein MutS2
VSYSLETLEYERVLGLFARFCRTPMGNSRVAKTVPFTDRNALERELAAITETIELNHVKQVSWTFSELSDPADAVAILKIKGAALEPMRMLEAAAVCSQAIFTRSVLQPEKETAPILWEIVENIPPSLMNAVGNVTKKILPGGEIDDSASPELASIRREISSQRARLTRSLENVIKSSGTAIQDEIVTMRNDRYVIPVKADFRGKVGGVAHGTSSSGATIFIEPLEAIEANNELQTLRAKEEREISRILFTLTEQLREELPAIETAVEAVAELDAIQAKVEFARSFNAVVPKISTDGKLELIDARHPLLEESLRTVSSEISKDQRSKAKDPTADGVVPSSFTLTNERSVMIISGANAGGKTVVLKTAGVLSLMAISGLPVPAREAAIPFYRSVLADIGDHQSLSANLSTFSSHMSNIAGMMAECVAPSLVLLDEAGTGTDPDEGSALGVAVVDHFRRKCSAHVIASTHYRGLKMYAANDENVINASVEFDEKTLQPTYKLLIGLAGASSGIEIARRFGLSDEVIAEARKNLDPSGRDAEKYLRKLQTESKIAEDLRIALEEEREVVALKYAGLEIEAGKKERSRQREFENALARSIEDFDRRSTAFVKSIEDKALRNRLDKERLARKAELNRAILAKAGEIRTNAAENSPMFEPTTQKAAAKEGVVEIGSRVVTSFGNVGTVEKIEKDSAEVLVGGMRLREKMSNLRLAAEAETGKGSLGEKLQKQAEGSNLRLDTKDVAAELNLIGQTTADAEYEIDRFLDEAVMAGQPRVRIIHGFGTGALKNFVHHFLKGHPHVKKFAFAPSDQGGNGATIAEIETS